MLPYDLTRNYLPDYLPLSSSVNFVLRVIYIRLKYLISGFPQGIPRYKKRKIIFIHIPKNAGSSITKSLYNSGLSHTSALYYKLIDRQSFNEIESFALFRDPIDRFCSAFNYLKYKSEHATDICFRELHLQTTNTISDFIVLMQTNSAFKTKVLNYPHFRTQSEFVCDAQGRIIVNHIGHVSHIREFIEKINLHLNEDLDIGHRNKSAEEKKISESEALYITELYPNDFIIEKKILKSDNKVLKTPNS